jgi:hypothetical protein
MCHKLTRSLSVGAVLTLALGAFAIAQEDDPELAHFDEDRASLHEEESSGPIESGFVFIDGDFVPAPYTIALSEDKREVLINGRAVPGAIPLEALGMRSDRESRSSREEGRRRSDAGRNPWRVDSNMWVIRLRRLLEVDHTVVAFRDQPMWRLDDTQTYALLKSLLEPEAAEHMTALTALAGPVAAGAWPRWLRTIKPDEAFRRQAEPFVAGLDEAQSSNFAAIRAVQRFDAVAYPLTILGMILSVIAFGHLLMSLPNNDAMRRGVDAGGSVLSHEVVRATMISVVLVAVLSSLDLTWTILASQAGQMRELNPIASHFISNPMALIAFKSAATLLGCGLLYTLRNHSRAQLASWWMCLVCTMLTFRWLMFNSMFVT